MLNEGNFEFNAIYIACGYTNLRYGIDGLAATIREKFDMDPFMINTLFLFCGRKKDRIKGLVWEGDGFLLLYKRIEKGSFQWPRNEDEVRKMTKEQFKMLINGFSIESRISQISTPKNML